MRKLPNKYIKFVACSIPRLTPSGCHVAPPTWSILALARSLGSLWEAFSGYKVQGRECPGSLWEAFSGCKVQGRGCLGSLGEAFSRCRVEGEDWPGRLLKVHGTGQRSGQRFSGCGVQGEGLVSHGMNPRGTRYKVTVWSKDSQGAR